jgi:hypothetical protein
MVDEEKRLIQVAGQALQGLATILTSVATADDNVLVVESGSLDGSKEDFIITGTPLDPKAVNGIKKIEFAPSKGKLTIWLKKI